MKSLYIFICESKSTQKEIDFAEIVQNMRKQKMKEDAWNDYNAEVAAKICNNDFENDDYDDLDKNNPKYIIYTTVGENDKLADIVIELIQDNFKAYKNSNDEYAVLTKKRYSEYEGIEKLVIGYYLTNTDTNWTKWLKDYKGKDIDNIIKQIYEQ